MTSAVTKLGNIRLAYYSGNRKTGSLTVVSYNNGQVEVYRLPDGEDSGLDKLLKPVLVGVTEDNRAISLDPKSKEISFSECFPIDAFPAHNYSDPKSARDWLMNDGDKATGNDTLNFGDKGSSVTVVENTSSASARYLKTICVGRGHHQANFSYPTDDAPQVPYQAYVSNLNDGTISVIGNDPGKPDSYLEVVATINLAEPDKEEGGNAGVPNKSFPHGLSYSKLTGKVYNLNNGYGTVAVIDTTSHEIERRFELKGCSNLFATPCGRYVIGRGADRKSDADHVIAKLVAVDVTTQSVADSITLPDVYVSKYFFSPEGDRLYLTTSTSGSEQQQAHLKDDAVLVYDLTALPKLTCLAELRLGTSAGTLEFITNDAGERFVLASNADEGLMTIIDAQTLSVVDKVAVIEPVSHSRLWQLPQG